MSLIVPSVVVQNDVTQRPQVRPESAQSTSVPAYGFVLIAVGCVAIAVIVAAVLVVKMRGEDVFRVFVLCS